MATTHLDSLMRYTLGGAAGAVGVQGLLSLARGKSVAEVVKGGIQTAVGIAGMTLAHSLTAKSISTMHQAFTMAMPSVLMTASGISDFYRGRYRPALGKLLLGAATVATLGYCL